MILFIAGIFAAISFLNVCVIQVFCIFIGGGWSIRNNGNKEKHDRCSFLEEPQGFRQFGDKDVFMLRCTVPSSQPL